MLILACFICLIQHGLGSSLETRDDAWPSLEPDALQAFLVPFRESVLQRVAVGWNHTITDSARLQVDLQRCSDQIKATVEQCKTCAAKTCQKQAQTVSHSPTFNDYLNFAVQIINPVQYLKGPLNEVGDKFGDLIDLLGAGSDSFIDSMSALGNTVGGAFTNAFHGIEAGFNAVKDQLSSLGGTVVGGVTDVGGTVVGGITDVGNTIGDGLNSAGHAIEHAGHSVIHSIGSIFGRKRATISPELRACMTPCSVCTPLLEPVQRNMVIGVCGADVVKFNDTVTANVAMIKGIFIAVSDKVNPVITKVELDPASQRGVTFTRIYVTANVMGQYVRYPSSVTLDMMNMGSSARNVASEFWEKWAQT